MLLEKHLNYYKDILSEIENVRFSIILRKRNGYKDNDGFFDRMVEGGFVDWTYQMLGNKKERCLISGIGLERFLVAVS